MVVEPVDRPGIPQAASRLVARTVGSCFRYRVTGLDGSAAMLRLAQANAPGAQLLLADARDFGLDPPVDAVIAFSDIPNHALTLKDLDWGWWQACDDRGFNEALERMHDLIAAYATTYTYLSCDKATGTCNPVPKTVPSKQSVANLLMCKPSKISSRPAKSARKWAPG